MSDSVQLCLVMFLTTTICHATTLTQSTERLELGKSHWFTCSIESVITGMLFTVNKKTACTFNKTCNEIQCNNNFRYTCDINTYSATLTIPGSFNNDSYHHSSWQCEDLLAGVSNEVYLFITVPISSVAISQINADVADGNSQILTCITSAGRPNARIQWYISDGTNLTASATQQPDCGLCIDQVESTGRVTYIGKLSDHGKYIYCLASNLEGRNERSQNVTITILYGPSSVVVYPSNLSYTVAETTGSVGPITCTAGCRPNCTMTWSGPNLPDGVTSILLLQNIKRNQSGNYQCTAKNSVGNRTSGIVTVIVNYVSVELSPANLSYTITETTSIMTPINCTANCRPSCTVAWIGPYLPSGTASVLDLQNINRTQAGNYYCTANNIIGSLTSGIVEVIVNYRPSIVMLNPQNLSYIVNETSGIGHITCTVDCKPNCNMTWSGPNLPDDTTSVLNLQNIKRNQAGDYKCTANNIIGSKTSAVVTVVVNYGPNAVLLNTSTMNITVVENSGCIGPIICTADCRPNCTMTWSGPKLPLGTTSILHLKNINRNQTGHYMCTAKNFLGSNNSIILAVIVNYGPNNVWIKPQTSSYIVNETSGIGPITCAADCRPNCSIVWSGPYLLSETKSVLDLKNINRTQAGKYICTATNSVGNSTSAVIKIVVHYGPTIPWIDGNTTYPENDTAEFRCHVDSIPKSTIKWKFMDVHAIKKLPDENQLINKVNGSVLIVSPINCLSMGLYSCEASNGIGSTQMGSLNVTVMCAPRLNTIEYDVTYNIAVKDNQPLNITAPVIAYPKPWIYWKFFQNDSGINITNDVENTYDLNRHFSYLYIQNMTQKDFGIYAVYAGNDIGNKTNYIGTYDVQAARRPNKPSNVTCSAGDNYIIVNWQPEFHGGSPQSFRVFYNAIQGSSLTGQSDIISEANYHPVKILHLQSSSVYLLKVHAENAYNISISDEIYCNTTSQGDTETDSLIGAGVGAGLGSAVVVICVVLALIFIFRRLRTENPKNDTKPMKSLNEEEENDELKDNPLYASSVDKDLHQSDVYSQVLKGKQQDISSTEQKQKKKRDKSNKPMELGCVYENANDIIKGNEQIYANEPDAQKSIIMNYNPQKNKDGLIYADLDLAPVSEEKRFVIHGMDNRNNYAIIDLSKKGYPVPSDDEEDIVENEEI